MKKTALMPTEKTYTSVDDLAGCLAYHGKAKTLEEMDEGVRQGIIAKWGKHDADKFVRFDKKFRHKTTALKTGIALINAVNA